MRRRFIFLFVAWLAACSAPPTATPPPTPLLVRVAYPPSLSYLTGALAGCAEKIPSIALDLFEIPASALDIQQNEITLWLGEPPGEGFAALIDREDILVVLNPDNPVDKISTADLRALFAGRITNWEDVGGDDLEVAVWVYPPANELQAILESVILEGEKFTSLAWQAPDAAAMLESVAQDPAAIGILPRSWLSGEVKPVDIDRDLEELLLQPVLALAEEEPEGILREFVACLQRATAQSAGLGEGRRVKAPWFAHFITPKAGRIAASERTAPIQ